MWKCPDCGKENENMFCSNCGCKKPQEKQESPSVEAYLKRVFLFLEDGEWEKADEYCEKVLDIDPENPKAYLGKLMIDFKVKTVSELANMKSDFSKNSNYRKIQSFGNAALKDELKGYLTKAQNNERTSKNKFRKRLFIWLGSISVLTILFVATMLVIYKFIIPNNTYNEAISLYNEGKYEEAELLFNKIPNFKNATEYSNRCVADLVTESEAVEFFHNINDKMTYKEFVELYGELTKEDVRFSVSYEYPDWIDELPNDSSRDMGSRWTNIAKYGSEKKTIRAVYFWGTDDMPKDKIRLLNQQAYLGGLFNVEWTDEGERSEKKDDTVLMELYCRTKKEVSRKHFDEFVSYISLYEGKCTSSEYLTDKYEAKWINDKYEYTLTYMLNETDLKYSKEFK